MTRQYHGGSFRRKEHVQSSPSLLSHTAPSWAFQRPESVSPASSESTEAPRSAEEILSSLSTSASATENNSELD